MTTELRSWELFSAMVAGMRASVCGAEALVFSWTPPPAICAAGVPSTRIVKMTPAARANSSAGGFWGCLAAGLLNLGSSGGAAAPGAAAATLKVTSHVSEPGDAKPVQIRSPSVVRIAVNEDNLVAPEHVAAVLAELWDHSRALWTPLDPATLLLVSGPETRLPLATPVSCCFKVCCGLAARIARPVHTVSRTIRSPTGGSAILKSTAYGTKVLVINVDIGTATVAVIGKREGCRAVRADRPISRNLEVMAGNRGWRRRSSDPEPIAPGTLETALFAVVQALVEVIQK